MHFSKKNEKSDEVVEDNTEHYVTSSTTRVISNSKGGVTSSNSQYISYSEEPAVITSQTTYIKKGVSKAIEASSNNYQEDVNLRGEGMLVVSGRQEKVQELANEDANMSGTGYARGGLGSMYFRLNKPDEAVHEESKKVTESETVYETNTAMMRKKGLVTQSFHEEKQSLNTLQLGSIKSSTKQITTTVEVHLYHQMMLRNVIRFLEKSSRSTLLGRIWSRWRKIDHAMKIIKLNKEIKTLSEKTTEIIRDTIVKQEIIEVTKEVVNKKSMMKTTLTHVDKLRRWYSIGKAFRHWKRVAHILAIHYLEIELERKPKEIIKTIEIVKEVPVIQTEIKEVSVVRVEIKEVPVIQEVVKEIEVIKQQFVEVPVIQTEIREVYIEVPVIKTEVKEVIKEVSNKKSLVKGTLGHIDKIKRWYSIRKFLARWKKAVHFFQWQYYELELQKKPKEIIKEVEIVKEVAVIQKEYIEVPVIRTEIKEVPVVRTEIKEVPVIKEIIKEVEVIKDRLVEVPIIQTEIREVYIEVPVIKTEVKEVIKEVGNKKSLVKGTLTHIDKIKRWYSIRKFLSRWKRVVYSLTIYSYELQLKKQPKEIFREVERIVEVPIIKTEYIEVPVIKTEIKEVPVIQEIIKEVEVIKDRLVEVPVFHTEIKEVFIEVPVVKTEYKEIIVEVENKKSLCKGVLTHLDKIRRWYYIGKYFRRWKRICHYLQIQYFEIELRRKPKEIVKEVERIVEVPVIKTEYVEVPVIRTEIKEVPVIKEIIKEVEVIKDRLVEVPIIQTEIKEVYIEVPIIKTQEVIKEVGNKKSLIKATIGHVDKIKRWYSIRKFLSRWKKVVHYLVIHFYEMELLKKPKEIIKEIEKIVEIPIIKKEIVEVEKVRTEYVEVPVIKTEIKEVAVIKEIIKEVEVIKDRLVEVPVIHTEIKEIIVEVPVIKTEIKEVIIEVGKKSTLFKSTLNHIDNIRRWYLLGKYFRRWKRTCILLQFQWYEIEMLRKPKEIIKEVERIVEVPVIKKEIVEVEKIRIEYVEVPVIKTEIKEVPVIKEVIKEIEVIKDRLVEVPVIQTEIREVIVEVPVIKTEVKEVIKEVGNKKSQLKGTLNHIDNIRRWYLLGKYFRRWKRTCILLQFQWYEIEMLRKPKEIIKEVERIVEVPIIKTEYIEVPIVKTEIKEVPVIKEVVKEIEVVKERIIEVPIVKTEIKEVRVEVPVIKTEIKEVIVEVLDKKGVMKGVLSHIDKIRRWYYIGKYFRRWKRICHYLQIEFFQMELSRKPKEVIKTVEVLVEVPIVKTEIKEVPVIKTEIKEVPVIKEVIKEIEVIKDRLVEVPVIHTEIREVIVEVPVIKTEIKEVIKEVGNKKSQLKGTLNHIDNIRRWYLLGKYFRRWKKTCMLLQFQWYEIEMLRKPKEIIKEVERIVEVPVIQKEFVEVEVIKTEIKEVPVVQIEIKEVPVIKEVIKEVEKIVEKLVEVEVVRTEIKEVRVEVPVIKTEVKEVIKEVGKKSTLVKSTLNHIDNIRRWYLLGKYFRRWKRTCMLLQFQWYEIEMLRKPKEIIKEVERIVEVPIIKTEYIEVPIVKTEIKEVPLVQIEIKEVPVIQEVIKEVEKIVERIVEVPVVEYREVRIEVPVIKTEVKEIIKEVGNKKSQLKGTLNHIDNIRRWYLLGKYFRRWKRTCMLLQLQWYEIEMLRKPKEIVKEIERIVEVPVIKTEYIEVPVVKTEIKEVPIIKEVIKEVEKIVERIVEVPVYRVEEKEVIVEKAIIKTEVQEIVKEVTNKKSLVKNVLSHIERIRRWYMLGKYFRRWKQTVYVLILQSLEIEILRKPKEVIKEIERFIEVPVVKTEIKEVSVIKEVIKEVPVIKEVIKEVEKIVEKIIEVQVTNTEIKEVIVEVPVIKTEIKEVIKEVGNKKSQLKGTLNHIDNIRRWYLLGKYFRRWKRTCILLQFQWYEIEMLRKPKEIIKEVERIVEVPVIQKEVVEVEVIKIEYVEVPVVKTEIKEVPVIKEIIKEVEVVRDRIVEVPVYKTEIKEVTIEVPVIKTEVKEIIKEIGNKNAYFKAICSHVDRIKRWYLVNKYFRRLQRTCTLLQIQYYEIEMFKKPKEIIKEIEKIVEVPVIQKEYIEVPIVKTEIKEVPIIKEVIKEIEKIVEKIIEVEVIKTEYKEVPVQAPIVKTEVTIKEVGNKKSQLKGCLGHIEKIKRWYLIHKYFRHLVKLAWFLKMQELEGELRRKEKEVVIKEIEIEKIIEVPIVTKEIVEVEVIREVPVIKIEVKEVEIIKEVPVIVKEIQIVEVIKNVPIIQKEIVEVQVIKEVPMFSQEVKEVEITKESIDHTKMANVKTMIKTNTYEAKESEYEGILRQTMKESNCNVVQTGVSSSNIGYLNTGFSNPSSNTSTHVVNRFGSTTRVEKASTTMLGAAYKGESSLSITGGSKTLVTGGYVESNSLSRKAEYENAESESTVVKKSVIRGNNTTGGKTTDVYYETATYSSKPPIEETYSHDSRKAGYSTTGRFYESSSYNKPEVVTSTTTNVIEGDSSSTIVKKSTIKTSGEGIGANYYSTQYSSNVISDPNVGRNNNEYFSEYSSSNSGYRFGNMFLVGQYQKADAMQGESDKQGRSDYEEKLIRDLNDKK
jgi:hypothetical protein